MGSRTGFGDDTALGAEYPPVEKGLVRELLETILVCVVVVLFLRAFVFQQSEIPSGSMETTILIGDHVLVNRFIYAPTSFSWERAVLPIRDIRRGDVVVFKHPDEPEQDFIKRVIGLPGDVVELRAGALWINGLPIDEPYLVPRERRGASYPPVTVEPDKVFLLGDHRSRSADSRVWGQAPRHLIKGRAFMILFSVAERPEPGKPPGQVTPKSLGKKLFNLVFHARWERFLTLIH